MAIFVILRWYLHNLVSNATLLSNYIIEKMDWHVLKDVLPIEIFKITTVLYLSEDHHPH